MCDFKEKRVWLVKMQSRLTATNAYMIHNSFIPKIKNLLFEADGHFERKDIGHNIYLIIFSDAETLNSCLEELKYISNYRDVTEQVIDGNYNKVVKRFNVENFYRLYETDYLNKLLDESGIYD